MKKLGLWQVANKSLRRLSESSIGFEKELEDWIENDPSLVQSGLEIIGRQISIDGGKLDLLALDPQGRLTIIEIKRGMLRREIIAQILDYASSLHQISDDELEEKIGNYLQGKQKSPSDILDHRNAPDALSQENREFYFIIIGTSKEPGLERMTGYLAQHYNFPISILTFQVFETPDHLQYLAREISETETKTADTRKKSPTVEDVLTLAKANGLGTEFDKLLAVGSKLGFYPKPWKTSIMFTPPTNKTRMLFTIWTAPSKGNLKAYVGPSAFAEFYPISEKEVISYLGEDGWRYWDERETDRFISRLQEMFDMISQAGEE
jgi:Holliday junction resolvase-like predicted endonuclease